jgi:lipid-A-disaccharide synthase
MPGSREGEVRRILPILRDAALRLSAARPDLDVVLVRADSISDELLRESAGEAPARWTVVSGPHLSLLAASDLLLVASGTATLETALIGTPFVTIYRMSALSHAIAMRLVHARWASLPNLLLGEPAVLELLQNECRPETIAAEIERLLDDPAAAVRLKEKCGKVRALLGPGGAAVRAAAAVAREAGWAGR